LSSASAVDVSPWPSAMPMLAVTLTTPSPARKSPASPR
jgi:hypothetical protein